MQQSRDKNQGIVWDRYSPQAGESWRNRDFSTLAMCRAEGREEGERRLAQGSGLWLKAMLLQGQGQRAAVRCHHPLAHLVYLKGQLMTELRGTFVCDFITDFRGKHCVSGELMNSRQEEAEECG